MESSMEGAVFVQTNRDLGTLPAERGDAVSVRTELEESLSIARSVGDVWGIEQTQKAMAPYSGDEI